MIEHARLLQGIGLEDRDEGVDIRVQLRDAVEGFPDTRLDGRDWNVRVRHVR
ncbi:hypothetical protein D3C83_165270 [compost metagenome]